MSNRTKYLLILILISQNLFASKTTLDKLNEINNSISNLLAIENILTKKLQNQPTNTKSKTLATLTALIANLKNIVNNSQPKNNKLDSIDTDLEFITTDEQTQITKAGGDVTTAQDFSALNIIIKTANTTTGVTGSGITIDSKNNMQGINTLSAESLLLSANNASSPSIIFPGTATNTGIYSSVADTTDISAKGSNLATFNSTGVSISPGKSLTVNGATTFNDAQTFNNAATFSGATNITGNTNLSCTNNFGGTINFPNSTTTTLSGVNSATGTVNFGGTTNITGQTTLGGTATITGTTTITGQTNITSSINLNPGGSQTSPAITFNGNANSGIFSTAAKNVSISASGAQQLKVYATGISATGMSMTGDINMNNNNITGINSFSLSSANTINANSANINGPLNVTGATNLNGILNVTGSSATNLYSTLNVAGAATFGGGLTGPGPISLNGTVSITGVSMSGDINMGGKNITGANIINSSNVLLLSPGFATGPTLSFNGNTDVGLSCTTANTINFSGGTTGINATISPSGVSITSGGLIFSNYTTVAGGDILLYAPYSLYLLTGTGATIKSSNTGIGGGRMVILANTTNSPINVTGGTSIPLPPNFTIGANKMQILTYIDGYSWSSTDIS